MNVQNNLFSMGRLNYTPNHKIAKSLEQIASGLALNRASDNASGLAVSEKLSAQFKGLDMSEQGLQDGMNLLNTADSGMSAIGDLLGRMRELSGQAANGIYGDAEREALNVEFNALRSEISRIASTTDFNGKKLLDGSADAKNGGVDLQVGANRGNDQKINFSIHDLTEKNLNLSELSLSTQDGATLALSVLDDAVNAVNYARGDVGATTNVLEHTAQSLAVSRENTLAGMSRIQDMDMAKALMNNTKNQILAQASLSMMAQGSNISQMALQLLK